MKTIVTANVLTLSLALMLLLIFSARGDERGWLKLDDFQSPAAVTSLAPENGWNILPDTVAVIEAVPGQAGGCAARIGHTGTNTTRGSSVFNRGLLRVQPGRTGTVFLRFMIPDGVSPDGKESAVAFRIALSSLWLDGGCAYGGVNVSGGKSIAVAAQVPDGNRSLKLERNRWYKLWLIVENFPGKEGHGKAYIQEDQPGAVRQEVPGSVLGGRPEGYMTLSVVGIMKAAHGRHTDLWIDDLYVDNGGANSGEPPTGGTDAQADMQLQSLSLVVPLKPQQGTAIARAATTVDALGKTDRYQAMWPTDAGMPVPQFPMLRIKPVLVTDRGVTITREYPQNKPLEPNLPRLALSVLADGRQSDFFSGSEQSQIAYRMGNLLKLVDTSAPIARSLEMALVSHRLVLLRIKLAGGEGCSVRADWSAPGLIGADAGDTRVIVNRLGRHALASIPGRNAGETMLAIVYDAATSDDLKAELDKARGLASDFDGLWAQMARPQNLEPFLVGTETQQDRDLVAACVNLALRTRRQAGLIREPAGLEFFGPEWWNAYAVWINFQPACRYDLWIEPTFWRNSIRTLLESQWENGCVPQTVWPNGGTKTSQFPNISPCVRDYYVFTKDRAFLEFAYPRFGAWYDWWMKERNPNGDGIITAGDSKLGAWASICEYKDNNTNPENPAEFEITCNPLTRTAEFGGRPERVYLPDIIACQARMAEDLAFMARELGDKEGERRFASEYIRVKEWANANLWDEETKFYYPASRATGKKLMKRSNVAFWMMWAGIPDRRQAAALTEAMFDPKQFYTPIPLPMIAVNDPSFNPKSFHWGDGMVWPIDVLHAFDGLLRYGEWDKAALLAQQFNDGVFHALATDEKAPMQPNEHYHHLGKRAGVPANGTAGCLPLMFQRYLKDYKAGKAQAEWMKFVPQNMSKE